jgi:hypothetical protein
MILKNAKRLKNKIEVIFAKVFITDDALQTEREARKKLLMRKKVLIENGIKPVGIWVTRSIPPA